MATFLHPDLDSLPGPWITPPGPREGPLYGGRRAATLLAPDGVLVEIVEAG
jgi:hypothetical protein